MIIAVWMRAAAPGCLPMASTAAAIARPCPSPQSPDAIAIPSPAAMTANGPIHPPPASARSEEHTSELQSPDHLVCRLLLEKKKSSSSHTHVRSTLSPPAACLRSCLTPLSFLSATHGHHRALHPFPTRRSSDLLPMASTAAAIARPCPSPQSPDAIAIPSPAAMTANGPIHPPPASA